MVRRAVLSCLVLLGAWSLPAAAGAPTSEDLSLSSSVVTYGRTLGLDPAANPASYISDFVGLIYARPEANQRALDASLGVDRSARRAADDSGIVVPVPLTTDLWSRAVFHRAVPPHELAATILADRAAALLCRGLAALDDETLQFLAERPTLVTELYDHAAPALSAFASSLQIHDGKVVTPGGVASTAMWEAATGERVVAPERFVRVLYGSADGRLAYLYDTVAALDPARAAFVLGTWIKDAAVRTERFQALAVAFVHGYREWRSTEHPFTRPVNDFTIAVARFRVDPSGVPLAPAQRSFWTEVFKFDDAADASSRREENGLIDAAFLAEALAVNDMYVRSDRVDQMSFAQRVFGKSTDAEDRDVAQVLRALPRQRTLMWALDRMGITTPSVYVAASRRAQDVTGGDPNRFWTLAQFQGSLALISRVRLSETIDLPTAQRLVVSLAAVPLTGGRYEGGIARWIDRELMPVMPPAPRAEARLIGGLAGLHARAATTPRVQWEGQEYRLDFAAADARRVSEIRERQGGYSMDVALELARVARGPDRNVPGRSEPSTDTAARSLTALAGNFAPRSPNRASDLLPPGVTAPPLPRERIDRAIGELARVDERREPDRALRAVAPLVDTADMVVTEALLSLIYASELGDPDGPALLASNVALRHDFGFMLYDGEQRARRPWEIPRQEFQPGIPWHVTGSLLGLDVALASLSLRHINLDRFAGAPHLASVERDAFAVGAALMNARALHDADRDAIVAAIGRGRARLDGLVKNASDATTPAAVTAVMAVMNDARLDGWRRRALRWTLANRPQAVPALFSLGELVILGGGAQGADLDAWGTSGYASAGCLCTHLVMPSDWRLFTGRSQVAYLSFVVPDLNLRVAAALGELHLPAALARPVLAAAVQDFIDEATPTDGNDWWSLARWAQQLPRQRIEDYVAAAAAVDGPLVPADEPPFVAVP
jgi:hypothetical protein